MNLRTSVTRDAALHLLLKSSIAGRTQDAPAWRAECLRLLIRARADLNQSDGEGIEPLMLLLRPALQVAGRVELAMEMLDAGAKVRQGVRQRGWPEGTRECTWQGRSGASVCMRHRCNGELQGVLCDKNSFKKKTRGFSM